MKNLCCVIFCLILFAGCYDKNKGNLEVATVNVPLMRDDAPSGINDYLKFSHYVPLQTDADYLIGEISKVQMINNKIYILDLKQSTVFIFDSNGAALSKISRRGRGNGEYILISDFEVTPDGSIFLNDPIQGKIYVYDEVGNFKYNVENSIKSWSFKLIDDGRIVYNLGNGAAKQEPAEIQYNYVYVSEDGATHKQLPFNKSLVGHVLLNETFSSLFYQYGGGIYMSSMLNDTIYNVSRSTGELYPHLVFDFHEKRPSIKDTPQSVEAYLSEINKTRPSSPYGFYRFDNGSIAFYKNDLRSYMIIVSPDGTVLYSANTRISDEHGIRLSYISPFLDSDKTGYVINAVPAHAILAWMEEQQQNGGSALLNEMGLQVEEGSNRVLVFYNWVYE